MNILRDKSNLFVVVPVSVEVKKARGAPITVLRSFSWRTEALFGTILRSSCPAASVREIVARRESMVYIPM